jgi:hypothetical protein
MKILLINKNKRTLKKRKKRRLRPQRIRLFNKEKW